MSRRFGRNQRRQLRAELAAERALRLHGCAQAPAGTPRIEDMNVTAWSLRVDDDELAVDREATVMIASHRIPNVRPYAGRVSFQGGLYVVTDMRVEDSRTMFPRISLTLRGVAR